jgi:hypothetical protein
MQAKMVLAGAKLQRKTGFQRSAPPEAGLKDEQANESAELAAKRKLIKGS